jgi:hypothetical protein
MSRKLIGDICYAIVVIVGILGIIGKIIEIGSRV